MLAKAHVYDWVLIRKSLLNKWTYNICVFLDVFHLPYNIVSPSQVIKYYVQTSYTCGSPHRIMSPFLQGRSVQLPIFCPES
jgi:hypothetical protein